jgi:hypothetical protein
MDTTNITAEEIAIVRDAARHCAKSVPADQALLNSLADQWRALVPARHGERLVETFVQMYPSLEADGGIDSWESSSSKTVLTALVLSFPTAAERFDAVREALDVAQCGMGTEE